LKYIETKIDVTLCWLLAFIIFTGAEASTLIIVIHSNKIVKSKIIETQEEVLPFIMLGVGFLMLSLLCSGILPFSGKFWKSIGLSILTISFILSLYFHSIGYMFMILNIYSIIVIIGYIYLANQAGTSRLALPSMFLFIIALIGLLQGIDILDALLAEWLRFGMKFILLVGIVEYRKKNNINLNPIMDKS
jgi:hypothetical protein